MSEDTNGMEAEIERLQAELVEQGTQEECEIVRLHCKVQHLEDELAEALKTIERQGRLMEPHRYPGPIARALAMVNKERQRECARIVEILRGLRGSEVVQSVADVYDQAIDDAINAIKGEG